MPTLLRSILRRRTKAFPRHRRVLTLMTAGFDSSSDHVNRIWGLRRLCEPDFNRQRAVAWEARRAEARRAAA